MVHRITPHHNGDGKHVSEGQTPGSDDVLKSQARKVDNRAKLSFGYLENKVWPYIKNGSNMIKSSLKAALIKCPKLKFRFGQAIAGIGFLSGIAFFLTLKSIFWSTKSNPSSISILKENVSLHDQEGILMGVIGLIMDPMSAMGDLSIFYDSLSQLPKIPTVKFFNMIALPLAFTSLSFGTVKGVYEIVRSGIHLHRIQREIDAGNLDQLRKYIKEQLDVTDKERQKIEQKYPEYKDRIRMVKILKDKKRNVLSRQTHKKVANIMLDLQEQLEKNPNDVDTANKSLKDMHKLTKRKIKVGAVGILLNVALLVTLVTSAVLGVVPAIVIPIILVTKAGWAISKHVYNNHYFEKL